MEQEKFDKMMTELKEGVKRENPMAINILCSIYINDAKAEDIDESMIPEWQLEEDKGQETEVGIASLKYFEEFYEGQKKKKIFQLWKEKKYGDPETFFLLGKAYYSTNSFIQNEWLARKYFRKAALTGHKEAQFALGRALYLSYFPNTEWLHWICCSCMNGNNCANYFIKDAIRKGGDEAKAIVDRCFENIKENGIDSIFVLESPEEEYLIAKKLRAKNAIVSFFQSIYDGMVSGIKRLFRYDNKE